MHLGQLTTSGNRRAHHCTCAMHIAHIKGPVIPVREQFRLKGARWFCLINIPHWLDDPRRNYYNFLTSPSSNQSLPNEITSISAHSAQLSCFPHRTVTLNARDVFMHPGQLYIVSSSTTAARAFDNNKSAVFYSALNFKLHIYHIQILYRRTSILFPLRLFIYVLFYIIHQLSRQLLFIVTCFSRRIYRLGKFNIFSLISDNLFQFFECIYGKRLTRVLYLPPWFHEIPGFYSISWHQIDIRTQFTYKEFQFFNVGFLLGYFWITWL